MSGGTGSAASAASAATAIDGKSLDEQLAQADALVARLMAQKGLFSLSGSASQILDSFRNRFGDEFRFESAPVQLALNDFRHSVPDMLERDPAAFAFLSLTFTEFDGTAKPPTTGAPLQRRPFIATQAAPGGGKSRYLDLIGSLCGPISAGTDAHRIWTEWSRLRPAHNTTQLKEFRVAMQRTIPIPVTFYDYQSDHAIANDTGTGTTNRLAGNPLALRLIHRYCMVWYGLKFHPPAIPQTTYTCDM